MAAIRPIFGAPIAGTFAFTARVTDHAGASTSRQFSIPITAPA